MFNLKTYVFELKKYCQLSMFSYIENSFLSAEF